TIELLPRLISTGWHKTEIENILIILLDHGNHQDVRMLGLYTLCIYIVAMNGNYSDRTIDLFTNAICLRAFSYVDRPGASQVVGQIMSAIAGGIDIPGIGCGQKAIIGFQNGRASICPVLLDTANPISPQGIMSLRMIKDVLGLIMYLASLIPEPQAAYVEYIGLGFIYKHNRPFHFLKQRVRDSNELPLFAPMFALNHAEVQASLTNLYQLFRKAYLSWIYVPKNKNVRQIPVMGLRVFINFMTECMVSRQPHMLLEKEFCMPNINSRLPAFSNKTAALDESTMDNKLATGLETMSTRAYGVLRHIMLDTDLKSTYFFIDVLRLSLQAMPNIVNNGPEKDSHEYTELLQTSYENCLGVLTVVRMWLASSEEYRPVHLFSDEAGDAGTLLA
ncbi:hypothetical protein GGF37_006513, partial [Kickxella alabastrina]